MEIAELTRLFEDVPVMYIADGHHRSAAAMRVADELGKTPRHGSNEEFQKAMKDYFDGNVTKDKALDNFYKAAIEKYPNLSK